MAEKDKPESKVLWISWLLKVWGGMWREGGGQGYLLTGRVVVEKLVIFLKMMVLEF